MTNTEARDELTKLLEYVREDISHFEQDIAADRLLNAAVVTGMIEYRMGQIQKALVLTQRAEHRSTWETIAYRFGITKQAAQQRFSK